MTIFLAKTVIGVHIEGTGTMQHLPNTPVTATENTRALHLPHRL